MRKLFLLSLILCLGLSTHISANSSEEGIQKIIDYIMEGKKISNKKITLQEIQFVAETTNIASESKPELDKIAELLLKIPTVAIEISNHTDNKGDKSRKKQLTQRRAKSVVDYLTLKGVPYQQLNYKGWGWHRPMADNRSAEGRKKNNRTELLITGLIEGPHNITTGQNIIPVANLVIDEDKVIYWKTSTGDAKDLALNEVQQIELAYGKKLIFDGATAQNKVVTEEKPRPKIDKPTVSASPPAKTTSPPTLTTLTKPSTTEAKLRDNARTQKSSLTKKQKTPTSKEQKEVFTKNDPFKSGSAETVKKKNKDRNLVKTPPSPSTPKESKVTNSTNSTNTPVSTPKNTKIVETENLPKTKPKKTITSPKEIKNEKELTKTTKNLKKVDKKPSSSTKVYADLTIPSMSEEKEQVLLNTYLSNYEAPQNRKTKPLYSENILKQYDADFDWTVGDGIIVQTTNIWGKIKYLFLKSKGEPKEKQASSISYMFHLGQRPIHVEPSVVSLRYQDASGRSENIRLNETLTANSRGFVFRAGIRYGIGKWEGYFAGDFGGRNGARYNAAVFGLMYKKAFGKFSVLPGAEISLGAGKFELGDVNVETPIFTVKKKDFLGDNISLAYKNKLLGLSPTVKLVYNVSPKFDIYVSTGYMLALRTGSRIKFSGTGTDEASVSTNTKLKADNLTFMVNGETFTRKVDILNYNGLLLRLGVFINMPTK